MKISRSSPKMAASNTSVRMITKEYWFLQKAGFKVAPICGEGYLEEVLPVFGFVEYDMNRLFVCEKKTCRV